MESYYCMDEIMGKQAHDPLFLEKMKKVDKVEFDPIFVERTTKNVEIHSDHYNGKSGTARMFVPGPLIVGAGPSGLAVAASLRGKGVPNVVLERSSCIGSLWQLKTYDRLCLHLPKQFCQLPHMPFPEEYPTYPNRNQFITYLHDYAEKFGIRPRFNETVARAEYDPEVGFWRVTSVRACGGGGVDEEREYVCRWLVVATGENAEAAVPEIPGIKDFSGMVMHSFVYRNGEEFTGKRVLVVGCGNSGMEVSLDLSNHNAMTSLVVRDTVHVLPREVLGRSAFGLSVWLMKWLPVHLVDRILLLASWFVIGDTARFGLCRPLMGPMQLKSHSGKTPVLDVGTIGKIRSGEIKVFPGIKRVKRESVEFENGGKEKFDAIILATGYKSNVPSWLKENEMFSEKDGFPRRAFPNGWKGEQGLYAVGFSRKGLLGASIDSQKIAEDVQKFWQEEGRQRSASSYSLLPNFTH